MTKSQVTKGIIATILAALVWSTGGLLVKWISLDPFTILFYRSAYAAAFFMLVFRKEAFQFGKRALITSLFYAPLLICFVTATKLTSAANAIFLQYIAPAVVLVLEPRMMKVKMKRSDLITVIICTFGLSFFLFGQKANSNHWWGDGLALLSGFAAAGLYLSMRISNRSQQMSGILLGNFIVVLVTLPMFLKSGAPTLQEHGMLAFLGLIQIGLGYVLFTYGQRRIPAIESSLFAMLEPILNPVWVMIGYGEVPGIYSWIGGGIILGALVVRMLLTNQKSAHTEHSQK